MKRIAIFASGEGTNTQHLIDYFKGSNIQITVIVCNNPNAQVLTRAKNSGIPSVLTNKEEFYTSDKVLKRLLDDNIDLIICAGFLWKIPTNILRAFPDRIVNIHPALLPKFGGKGMYGSHIHEAVKAALDAGEITESGFSMHFVTDEMDRGPIFFEKSVPIESGMSADDIAAVVKKAERQWQPKITNLVIHRAIHWDGKDPKSLVVPQNL